MRNEAHTRHQASTSVQANCTRSNQEVEPLLPNEEMWQQQKRANTCLETSMLTRKIFMDISFGTNL
jgi:hypothetical protein